MAYENMHSRFLECVEVVNEVFVYVGSGNAEWDVQAH